MAHNPSNSSGLLAASAAVSALPAYVSSLQVVTDGTNQATVILYDNPSAASGTVLVKIVVPGASGNGFMHFNSMLIANKGIYCSVSGTGAGAVVGYCNQ